jgi:type I restriction enzyme, S subunit
MTRLPLVQLGELVHFLGGGTPNRDRAEYWNGQIPWASVKDLQESEIDITQETITEDGLRNSASNLVPANTVIIASRVGLGKAAITLRPMAINQDLKALLPTGGNILPRYLLHYFSVIGHQIERAGVGATVKGVTVEYLRQLQIPLPSLSRQESIVQVLDEAQALRHLRRQSDKLTVSIAPSLFEQLFGDPVNNTRSWQTSTVGDHLAMLEYGPRFYNEAYTESGTRIVRITDLEADGNLRFDDMPRIEVDSKTLEARQLRAGDFVFARTGATVGKVALMTKDAPVCIAGAYFIRFRFSEDIDPVFGFALLRSPAIQGIITRQSKQAAQQNFSGPLIKSLPLIVPPHKLQRTFADHIRKIHPLLSAQNKSRNQLDDLLPSLLHRAFRGKL